MRLHPLIVSALCAAAVFAEVKIEPPSPYMSSPPPSLADTTVIDPGRKPRCETQPGIAEAWYADWNLATDRPSAGPLEIKAPRRNQPTIRVAFDENGWPTEVVYYDPKGRPRWTKLFKYPAQIPAGPGDVPYTNTWIGPNGKAIPMASVAENFKNGKWLVSMKKYEVGDVLGEPLMVEINSVGTTFSANAETWVYFIDGKEVRFSFDKDNHLVALPVTGAASVPAKAEPAKPVADTSKPKDVGAKAAVDTAKPKSTDTLKPVPDTAAKAPETKPAKHGPGKAVQPKVPAKPMVDTLKKAPDAKPEASKAASEPAKPAAKPVADTAKPKPVEPPKPKYTSKAKLVVDDTVKPKAK